MTQKKADSDFDDFDLGYNPEDIWVTAFTTKTAIEFHDRINQKFRQNPKQPIVIYLNSPGGDISALFQMMDSMDALRAAAPPEFYFITVVSGDAASAGAFLLAHGDLRIATPRSSIMLHQVSGYPWSPHVGDINIHAAETTRVNDQVLEIFVEDTEFHGGVDGLKKYLERDKYLTPTEAKQLKIVDEVGNLKVETVTVSLIHILDDHKRPKHNKNIHIAKQIEQQVQEKKQQPKKKSKK